MQQSELGRCSALCDMKSLKGERCQCSLAPLKLCWTRDGLLQTDILNTIPRAPTFATARHRQLIPSYA